MDFLVITLILMAGLSITSQAPTEPDITTDGDWFTDSNTGSTESYDFLTSSSTDREIRCLGRFTGSSSDYTALTPSWITWGSHSWLDYDTYTGSTEEYITGSTGSPPMFTDSTDSWLSTTIRCWWAHMGRNNLWDRQSSEEVEYDSVVVGEADAVAQEVEDNSIQFSLQGMRVEDYTIEKEIILFTLLAATASEVCAEGSCDAVGLNSKRLKRAAMVFTADDFGRLPGYPMDDGRGGILLAIYSKTSDGTGVLEADKLVTAIQKTSADIEKILGVTMTSPIPITDKYGLDSTTVNWWHTDGGWWLATEIPDHRYTTTIIVSVVAAVVVIIVIIVAIVIVKRLLGPRDQRNEVGTNYRPTTIMRTDDRRKPQSPQYSTQPSPFMTDHDLSAPAYHSMPQVVAPTSVLYPAVRPMSASKQFQEHSGWGTTSSRDTCTPVQVDEKGGW